MLWFRLAVVCTMGLCAAAAASIIVEIMPGDARSSLEDGCWRHSAGAGLERCTEHGEEVVRHMVRAGLYMTNVGVSACVYRWVTGSWPWALRARDPGARWR